MAGAEGRLTAKASWERWKVSSAWWVSSSVGASKVGMKWSDYRFASPVA
jgi:hypothetical protein